MQSLLKQRYCSTFQGSSVRYWEGKPKGSGKTYTTNPLRPYAIFGHLPCTGFLYLFRMQLLLISEIAINTLALSYWEVQRLQSVSR